MADFQKKHDLGIVKKLTRKIRWTVSADSVLLFDDWSPYSFFTVVPYFPYFRRGRPIGMVRNLLSPQEQYNKVASQELHIVNTTANSGWIVQKGSLGAGMTVDELEKKGAKTGLIIEYNPGFEAPEKIQPNQIPTGLDRIGLKSAQNIKEISGVSDALLGMDGAEVSGIAIQAKQARGQIQLQVPLDNLARTRQFLARNILKLIQTYYTEERIIQVTRDDLPGKPREQMIVNERDISGRIINDLTLGEYDIVITSMPARDVFNDSQFAEALELRAAGVAIPDDIIIDYSNLSRKAELATRLREMMGLEQSPEQEQLNLLMSQIEMKRAELELNKLEAEVEKLRVEAGKTEAETIQLVAGAKNNESLQALTKLEAELARKREEIESRRELVEMQTEAKTLQTQIQARTALAQEEIKAETERYKADKQAKAQKAVQARQNASQQKPKERR